MSSFDDLNLHRGSEKMNSGMLSRTMVEQSRVEGYRLKTLLSGDTCTGTSASRLVGLKAGQ